jgi:probable HAF family extracellular repeat protein
VNDSGHVVGYSQYLHKQASSGFLFTNGGVTPIDVPGASETYAEGINNRDEIVGYFKTAATENLRRGFLYKNGVFTMIDVPGAKATWAEGINDSGEIVGGYDDGRRHSGSWHGFLARLSSR